MRRSELSPQQKEILYYLTKEFLTVKKIALLRKTTTRAVYKTIDKLKKKGFISGTQLRGFTILTPTPKLTPPPKSKRHLIRLHGVSFRIKILESSDFYKRSLNQKNIYTIQENTIRAFKDSLILHINKDFTYSDEIKATAECFNYLNRFLIKLENELGVILIRSRYTEIKLLSNHYAEIDNELAEEHNKKKIGLDVYALEDGKLWFHIDNSFNLNEAETLHTKTAEEDMTKVKTFFNDVRSNKWEDIKEIAVANVKSIQQTNSNMEFLVHSVKELTKIIKERI